MPCPEKTNTIGGRVLGARTGLLKDRVTPALDAEPSLSATANARQVIDRARRPNVWASPGAIETSSPSSAIACARASPTAVADRGDSPPATRRAGTDLAAPERQNAFGARGAGAPSITACPFAPPIPELVIAIRGMPFGARARRGSGSTGTLRRYSFHPIMWFGVWKLTLGGMTRRSSVPQTLQNEARNAVISRCLPIEEPSAACARQLSSRLDATRTRCCP